ncbi:Eukaryotic translation initiation factor 3 subunit [Hortaea werneckii]|nr:Eukaryotic translation initiation factor 3 subunit [Hortaea werneckii]
MPAQRRRGLQTTRKRNPSRVLSPGPSQGRLGSLRGTYVGNSEGSEVVPFKLATHSLTSSGAALSQVRWHVTAATTTERTSCIAAHPLVHVWRRTGSLALGRHGVLEGTLGGEVVTATDTTLDLHLLQGLGLLVLLRGRFLLVVVSGLGPAGLPVSGPILGHALRSATRGFSFFLITVRRMRCVRLTFLPSSLMKMVTTVSVPSLFFVICGGGTEVARSGSSSSAQSVFPGVFCTFAAMATSVTLSMVFDRVGGSECCFQSLNLYNKVSGSHFEALVLVSKTGRLVQQPFSAQAVKTSNSSCLRQQAIPAAPPEIPQKARSDLGGSAARRHPFESSNVATPKPPLS